MTNNVWNIHINGTVDKAIWSRQQFMTPNYVMNNFSIAKNSYYHLSLIWVGFLEFVCGGGGLKITPCMKPVRIKLETWNLIRKYTHIYEVLANMPFSTKNPLILLMSAK